MRKKGEKNEQGLKKLRNRAEKSLGNISGDQEKSPVEDTRKLIHELRVHQIELEMQNEELRKAQMELAESRDRYFDLYDFAPIGYFTLDEKGLIQEVNLTGADLVGSERASLIRKGFSQFVAPGSQELFYSHCKRSLETRTKQICEIELRRKDGRSFWAQIQSVAMIGEEGNFIQLRTAAVDITQRKHAEVALSEAHSELERRVVERTADLMATNEQLSQEIDQRGQAEEAFRESEIKYRIVADNTYDWEWWRDPEGNFVYVSPSCKDITHHAVEEFAADPELLLRIIHPDDQSSFIKHTMEVEGGDSSDETEFRIVRPDGSVRWIAHACRPVFDEQGRFLGRRGSNRDITKRKETEKALRESEERYRTLVETMNEGLGVADERDVWTYVNEKFCNMLGYSHGEIIGRPVYEWLDEANQKILGEQLIKRKSGEQEPYEIAWMRKDGSSVHTQVSPKPVFDEAGQFQGSFAVITDITERKKAEESLHNALSEIKTLKERLEAENIYFRHEIETRHKFENIIGQSNAFKYVLYRAEQVAPSNTTVLLLGETGTGKELIAAAIHQMSPRKDRPLVTVNCAALPANLIESELFGREKGAFTGADTRQTGRFDVANGSTLCLDEIGELPLEVQAKLLRVLQHNEFERLGSSRTIKVDVRIVATTNRDLEEEVRKGRFRQDLYYRLSVFPLTVPPLRQRKDDIPLLVQVFTARFAREHGKEITAIPKETMKALQDYDWPGNVRELENVIERAVILGSGQVLRLTDKLQSSAISRTTGLRTMEETERDQILKTLSETRWRINGKKGAAAILGLHPSTLRARMHKLGIRRPEI